MPRRGPTTARSACRSPSSRPASTPATSSSRWVPRASATSATSPTWSARTSASSSASAPPTPANSAAWRTSPSPRANSWRRCRAGGTAVLNLDDPRVAAMAARTRATVLGYTSAGHRRPGPAGPRGERAVRSGVELNAGGHPEFELLPARADAGRQPGPRRQQADRRPPRGQPAGGGRGRATPPASPARRSRPPSARRRPPAAGGWSGPSGADGVTVINDAYNANPESMRAALRTLADLGRGRRHLGGAGRHAGTGRRIPSASTWRSAPRWCG